MNDDRHPPEVMQAELASLVYLLGGIAPKHLVVVGGLVPPLLVPEAAVPHRGSADIDLSLSVAITTGKTSEYYKSLEETIDPFFELAAGGFRWRKREGVPGIPLLVDFLGSDGEATHLEDGTMELADGTATKNTGLRLRPYPLSAAAIVDEDADATLLEDIPIAYENDVLADVEVRHAGPVGFLASKADAFATRSDSKDGYDVAWWSLNAAEQPEAVAQQVLERPAFKDPYFQESVALLRQAFKSPKHPGPSGYAKEAHEDLEAGDPEFERSRNEAYLSVSSILEILLENLWPDQA